MTRAVALGGGALLVRGAAQGWVQTCRELSVL